MPGPWGAHGFCPGTSGSSQGRPKGAQGATGAPQSLTMMFRIGSKGLFPGTPWGKTLARLKIQIFFFGRVSAHVGRRPSGRRGSPSIRQLEAAVCIPQCHLSSKQRTFWEDGIVVPVLLSSCAFTNHVRSGERNHVCVLVLWVPPAPDPTRRRQIQPARYLKPITIRRD